MLRWDGAWLTVDGRVFATVDPATFLAGLKDADAPKAMLGTSSPPPSTNGAPPILVWKSRSMIEQLAQVIEEIRPRCIIELGIAVGGSAALLAALAPEAKVVAIEIEAGAPALAAHIEHWGLQDQLRPYFGVDQGDRAALERIVHDEFGDAPIDLVIDDASHQLDLSRASMDILFPRVRPAGCYIVEDWAWSHLDLRDVLPDAPAPTGKPLTVLIVEMLMALGTGRGEVARVDCADTVRIWRGPAALDPGTWSVASSFFTSAPVLVD